MHIITVKPDRITQVVTEHRPITSASDELGKLTEQAAEFIRDQLAEKKLEIVLTAELTQEQQRESALGTLSALGYVVEDHGDEILISKTKTTPEPQPEAPVPETSSKKKKQETPAPTINLSEI